MDEFITLLPTHFDNDILKTLGLFRYNRKGNPESIKKAEEAEIIKQDTLSEEEQNERQEPDNSSKHSWHGRIFPPDSKNIKIREKKKYIRKYVTNKIYRRNESSMENSYSTTSAAKNTSES